MHPGVRVSASFGDGIVDSSLNSTASGPLFADVAALVDFYLLFEN